MIDAAMIGISHWGLFDIPKGMSDDTWNRLLTYPSPVTWHR